MVEGNGLMSEYTPDDYDMSAIYVAYSLDFSDDRRPGEEYSDGVRRCEAEFHRWLAQHDQKVAAKAKYDLLMMQLENVRLEVEEERAKEATNG